MNQKFLIYGLIGLAVLFLMSRNARSNTTETIFGPPPPPESLIDKWLRVLYETRSSVGFDGPPVRRAAVVGGVSSVARYGRTAKITVPPTPEGGGGSGRGPKLDEQFGGLCPCGRGIQVLS